MIDFDLFHEIGLTQHERQILVALLKCGVADAGRLCEVGGVPSSKVYSATEKLAKLGLISVQRTRPRLFAALSVEHVVNQASLIAKNRAERFATEAQKLITAIHAVQGTVKPTSAFADVAMGQIQHVQRHVAYLASAQRTIYSYMEVNDIEAIEAGKSAGSNVYRSIRKNTESRGLQHSIVFGFGPRDAPRLLKFLRDYKSELRSATGVRYAGLLGHPFHVIDRETVILSLDNPFLRERRFGSLMMHSRELAEPLCIGFEELWAKSMRNLREINFDPRPR